MESLLHAFVVLFIVVDPVGVAGMFVAMTHYADRATQVRMAWRGSLLAGAILFIFYFVGDPLLQWMHISLPAFRIAGGILLLLLAIDMVFARHSGLRSTTSGEQQEAERKNDISVFPLAFPLIAGPGALTTVLLMSSGHRGDISHLAMVLVLATILVITLLSLLLASYISRALGETGANVISRLLGVILAALAVQYVIDGIRQGFL